MTDTAEAAAYLERLRTDFGFFLSQIWEDRGLSRIHPLTVVEHDIAAYAESSANGQRFRGILAPRGLMKTHLIAALACYRFLRDPNRKILIPSKAHPHAKKIIAIIRRWIDNVWFLRHLAPREGQDDNKTQFQLGPAEDSLQHSMSAFGIDGMLEGNRAHSIFADDIETSTNTETLDARTALEERVKEFKDILYPDIPQDRGGPLDPTEILYVGTYHNEESLYTKLNARGYAFRTWTILAPHTDDRVMGLAPIIQRLIDEGKLKPSTAAGKFDGDPVFPLRFGRENIAEKKAEGFHRFAMQHMLICDLGASNRYPLRLADLIVMEIDRERAPVYVGYGTMDHNGSTAVDDIPSQGFGRDRLYRAPAGLIAKDWAPFTGTKAHLDIAGRGDDKTGFAIVSQLNGLLFVKHCEGLDGGKDNATMNRIAETCRVHGVREVTLESNIDIYDTFYELLQAALIRHFLEPGQDARYPDGWKCSLEKRHASGAFKEARILDVLEPMISTHRVIIAPAAIRPKPEDAHDGTLQYQLTRIRKVRKCLREDGQIDALAGAVAEWTHALGVSPEITQARYHEAEIDAQTAMLRKLTAGMGSNDGPCFIEI